jgi:ligand-binding SRPBCC domain-containing protein
MPQEAYALPESFSLTFDHIERASYRLKASVVLPVSRVEAFAFFEDPANLFEITPEWLDFRMTKGEHRPEVHEGAEFDYAIKWYGVTFVWRSRIVDYSPPERFTDIQIAGPYRMWVHRHTFLEVEGGTLMHDEVTYALTYGLLGRMLHRLSIQRQLEDIFRYRAARVMEWATGNFKRKLVS